MTKIKTNRSIFHSNAIRGCLSCRTLSDRNSKALEIARIKAARYQVLAQSSRTKEFIL